MAHKNYTRNNFPRLLLRGWLECEQTTQMLGVGVTKAIKLLVIALYRGWVCNWGEPDKQTKKQVDERNSPSATVCRVLERIFSPIRPYKIIIITIGNAKKTHVDTSHSGKLPGLSSIAQNAESGILSLAEYAMRGEMRLSAWVWDRFEGSDMGWPLRWLFLHFRALKSCEKLF